jgi:bacillithiol system protein YtxJ
MKWNNLSSKEELNQIDELSEQKVVILFKHSTRCSISTTALSRLERKWKENDHELLEPFYLDLLSHRDVSNEIATKYEVEHASPQILLIRNRKCVFNSSHLDIQYDEIITRLV